MYKIQLPNFEGPFDLLLYFIKRDELNIYNIPISKITNEFLSYVRLMKFFDLELAGEFILMASTLMQIKTQMLLPQTKTDESGELFEDPRTELVQKLLEYKQIKEASSELSHLEEEQRYTFYRKIFDAEYQYLSESDSYKNATLFDMMKAFQKVMERNKNVKKEHIVELIPISVEEQSQYLLLELKEKKVLSFFEFCKDADNQIIVVTFLSLLDLIRLRKIYCRQSDLFDDIEISESALTENNLEEENMFTEEEELEVV